MATGIMTGKYIVLYAFFDNNVVGGMMYVSVPIRLVYP
jgi:hypothetical protein